MFKRLIEEAAFASSCQN